MLEKQTQRNTQKTCEVILRSNKTFKMKKTGPNKFVSAFKGVQISYIKSNGRV